MARNGKISRLPRYLRNEVNRRLDEGMPGGAIVAWLNAHPEVQRLLERYFEGRPVNEQNLTEWRQGGYSEWLAQQEQLEIMRDVAGDAEDLAAACGPAVEHAVAMIAARFASLLSTWDGAPDHPCARKLKSLAAVSREVTALRRSDLSAARLRMEQDRHQRATREHDAGDEFELRIAMTKMLEKLLQTPEMKKLLERGRTSDEQRLAAIHRRLYGQNAVFLGDAEAVAASNELRNLHGDGI